jgi:predicted signal transduction protein with EAL and GGDEF domain
MIGDNVFIGASIGVAMFPADGATVDELLRRADIAMYKAKAAGRGRFIFSEESMNLEQRERSVMERELRKAVALGQLTVLYQPRVDLRDGRLCGAEALVRWHHPELGWVSPAKFIPLAEDLGLVTDLGAWILRHVCEQLNNGRLRVYARTVSSTSRPNNSPADLWRRGRYHSSTGVRQMLQLEITRGSDRATNSSPACSKESRRPASHCAGRFRHRYSSISYLRRPSMLKIDHLYRDMALDGDPQRRAGDHRLGVPAR